MTDTKRHDYPPIEESYRNGNSMSEGFGLAESEGLGSRCRLKSISKKVKFESPDKPDAVVSLLTEYGFTKYHISRLIKKSPQLILANPTKTLLPKLEFRRSIGVSGSELGQMVSWNSCFLRHSLEQHIIPCYNILKSVLVSDVKVVKSLKRTSEIDFYSLPGNMSLNLSILREVAVPQSIISYLLIYGPSLACRNPAKFRQLVNKVIEIGFDPLKATFAHALLFVSRPNVWERKMVVYRSCGLSEDEIWSAIRKFPLCMSFSVKKIRNTIDFLVNKMSWLPGDVARVPIVLCYSLEKRIVPRCSVVEVLLLKGLVKGEINLSNVLAITEKCFLDLFVIKYQEEVPQLLSIFRGEINIVDLGFGFQEKSSLSSPT
ncbi:hypothetical protein GH714_035631 [Hevea brasiliensis]|uniref:Uncharacterized protein n=1 Tax=Hevea brasiliensis TaxID=3981 RepID=A0A6A6L7C2_HEVBR|nr:hypothetical protein GH714_035631 [Hevea brasiliensis]